MPFFKKTNGIINEANAVYARDYTLTEGSQSELDLPLDGWVWAENQDEALVLLQPPEDATQAGLRMWWDSLSDADRALIYTHAANALLAWERGEMSVMIQLILTNDSPELEALKTQVQSMF